MSERFLLAISIGPVQPFIAAARKTRDFWCGSNLLSEIAREVAKALATDQADNLVFPAPQHQNELYENDFGVANKIVAIIDGDVEAAAQRGLRAAQEHLRRRSTGIFAGHEANIDRALAERQMDDLLELYWAAAPLDGENVSYPTARKAADTLLAARKNTREFSSFSPPSTQSSHPKCAIDGQRESVFLDKKAPEPLCGICFFKRHAKASSWSDATTTHFAAHPARAQLGTHTAERDTFVSRLRAMGVTDENELFAACLFDGRLSELITPEHLEDARNALRELKRATGIRPSPYYAILRADGDRMGKAIDACTQKEEHQQLSRDLVAFTKKAATIVRDSHGRLVYAGGDDVLALLPVAGAIPCARQLADEFKTRVGAPMQPILDAHGGAEPTPTLSVGVVVAHHLEPLADVLELSAKAEKEAKKTRNALAILVSKRSGSEGLVTGTWEQVDEHVSHLIGYFQTDKLPGGLPYELRDLAFRTKDLDEETRDRVETAELARIVGRKRAGAAREDSVETDIIAKLAAIRASSNGRLAYLASMLGVARDLAAISRGETI